MQVERKQHVPAKGREGPQLSQCGFSILHCLFYMLRTLKKEKTSRLQSGEKLKLMFLGEL